jgi:hypothetical protein
MIDTKQFKMEASSFLAGTKILKPIFGSNKTLAFCLGMSNQPI